MRRECEFMWLWYWYRNAEGEVLLWCVATREEQIKLKFQGEQGG